MTSTERLTAENKPSLWISKIIVIFCIIFIIRSVKEWFKNNRQGNLFNILLFPAIFLIVNVHIITYVNRCVKEENCRIRKTWFGSFTVISDKDLEKVWGPI